MFLSYDHMQAKVESEFHKKIQEACRELSIECGKALTELASAIRSMKLPATANHHIAVAGAAAEQLNKSFSGSYASKEILHVAAIVTLLLEIEGYTKQIFEGRTKKIFEGLGGTKSLPASSTIFTLEDQMLHRDSTLHCVRLRHALCEALQSVTPLHHVVAGTPIAKEHHC